MLGTVTIAGNGLSISYTPAASFQSLAVGETRTETFSYTVADQAGATATANVTVTVVGANDTPIVAGTVSGSGSEGSGIFGVDLLAGASDVDHGTVLHVANLIWNEVPAGFPAGFTLSLDGNSISVDTNNLAYDAMAQGTTFATHFSYDVVDQFGALVHQTATINIVGTNDGPIAVADTNTGDPVVESGVAAGGNTPFAGDPTASGNVLTNDTDVDHGDTRSVTTTGSFTGMYGTLTLASNGSYTYTLNNADTDTNALAQGESASDVFSYTIADSQGATSSSTLTINVTGTNDAPVITGGDTLGAVQEDGQLSAGGTLTATDVDHGATRTWTIVGGSPPTLTADYHFQIDDFRIIRNGLLFYSDGFNNNIAPPSGGLFLDATTGTYSIGPTNTVTEAGGRVNMDGAFGVPFAIGTGLGHFVTLNTDTTPDLTRGLKIDDDFTVEGRFDLISPDIGESYRIRVGDSVGPALGDDTIQLSVTRDAAGVLRVQLNELDSSRCQPLHLVRCAQPGRG